MPHKLPTTGRYRISNDVLITILEYFDPNSLYRTCKVFPRVYDVVIHFQHLRYKFELAVSGMADGVLSLVKRPPQLRLQLLGAYRRDWPVLNWTAEQKLQLPASANLFTVSAEFLIHGNAHALQLQELPSTRLHRPPSQTRHVQYGTAPQSDAVVVDPSQGLLISGFGITGPAGQIGIRLKIRDIWKFDKHPHAPAPFYECPVQVQVPIQKMTLSICGSRLAVSLKFANGTAKQLLLDWRSFRAMWMEEHDVHFLSVKYLLGAKVYQGTPVIHLYNIMDLPRVFIEREYELPSHWANAELNFLPNSTLTIDGVPNPRALFFSDPLVRVLVLTAKQISDPQGPAQWLMINESYFRPTSRPDRRHVPWVHSANFSLIRNVPALPVVRSPQVVGNRVIYLESDAPSSAGRGYSTRICTIEFPAYPEHRPSTRGGWAYVGPQSALVPKEFSKELSTSITRGAVVEVMSVTEDNIVFFLEPRHGMREVFLMSFGASI
ncbi:hypothetical protein CC1G_00870 [Coprinopsis cinerea okayama7|uniref:F-box domain-containing protein n=1 Tax=Coprinopsis cinerea (strain Okayama-7 / 130 / ATCC MYA-4618 / FGSC 9003) TaxID=240176 RepID=A8N8Z5_COPC7|nr:hypothetical protein CC1G_00870 [Coprinopsis cinerea okayama7\|eukprot:XP_001831323.1 hypothetical protein CC1G_00870 [Coprinopsis cinerea okayama7\